MFQAVLKHALREKSTDELMQILERVVISYHVNKFVLNPESTINATADVIVDGVNSVSKSDGSDVSCNSHKTDECDCCKNIDTSEVEPRREKSGKPELATTAGMSDDDQKLQNVK